MAKISIIVPVYNVEKYLDRCVESIINQTYTDFQLVLVDDGSQDNSSVMCDDWGKKDNRITVIHKENGGVSSARNSGIKNAKSELICFVDSDDYCEKCMLEKMISKYEDGFDFVFCAYKKNSYEGNSLIKTTDIKFNFTNGMSMSQMPQEFFVNGFFHSCWGKLYVRSIIIENCLMFNCDMKLSEDSYFNLSYFEYINSWAAINESLYSYCSNNDMSATKRIYKFSCRWYLNVSEKLILYINTIYDTQKAENTVIRTMFPQFYGVIIKMCHSKDKAVRKELNEIVKNDLVINIFKNFQKNILEKIMVILILNRLWDLIVFINRIYSWYSKLHF